MILSLSLSGYRLFTSGDSCERLTTKQECDAAAKELGLKNPSGYSEASEVSGDHRPPYCLWHQDTFIWFSTSFHTSVSCSETTKCICKGNI